MMKEQLISFKTAILAKEKEFNISTIQYYHPKGYCTDSMAYATERLEESNWNDGLGSYPTNKKDVECSAPTQSLLQKWLREVHKIHVDISTGSDTEYGVIFGKCDSPKWVRTQDGIDVLFLQSYEETLEIGLQEALKLIKND